MASCAICGKTTVFGGKATKIRTGLYSHTHRQIKPNLRTATLMIGGQRRRITACTRCISTAGRIRM